MADAWFQNADRYFMDRHAVEDLVHIQRQKPGSYWLSNWFLSLVDLMAVIRSKPGRLRSVLPEAEALDYRKFAEGSASAPAKLKLLMAFAHLHATWVAFDHVPGEADHPFVRMLEWAAKDVEQHWDQFFSEVVAFEGPPAGPMRNLAVFHAVGLALAWLHEGLTQRYGLEPGDLAGLRVLNLPLAAIQLQDGPGQALCFDFTQVPNHCVLRVRPDAVGEVALRVSSQLRQAHLARKLDAADAFKRGSAENRSHFTLRVVSG